jgi:hypothetical protein
MMDVKQADIFNYLRIYKNLIIVELVIDFYKNLSFVNYWLSR